MVPLVEQELPTLPEHMSEKHLFVSESYCTIAIVLFIYLSYTNKICLYQKKNDENTHNGQQNMK
jgi:hypothetical protein